MKIIPLLFLWIYALISCNLKNTNQRSEDIVLKNQNTISTNDSIRCSDITINSIPIGSLKEDIKKAFGKPDSVYVTIDGESSPELKYEVLVYAQSEFYFYNSHFFACIINDKKFTFNSLSIGDGINFLEKTYPMSFNNEIHKKNNQMIINCYGFCSYKDKKVFSPEKIIVTYDDRKVISQFIVFTN